jgi:hypothetical protein
VLADALGTYAATLIVIVVSTAIGSGVLAAAGARKWSPTSAVVGLAAASVIAWWAVRLPGHGLTALIVLLVVSALAGTFAAFRQSGVREGVLGAAPVALIALAAVSIPFVVEGHFGVLGTGFNVDMSQHLFAASWLADPAGLSPSLFRNGYPLGPHALTVAANEVTGELSIAFTGVTIAVPVLLAVAALAALDSLSRVRATLVAVLTALAYLAASYLAQGAFKELFEAAFLLGFALWLRDLTADRSRAGSGITALLPGAVIAAGALYVYSWPGLAWLVGTLGLWGLVELYRRRDDRRASIRRVLPCAVAGLLALAILAGPEIDRISKFGTSVDAVTERAPKPVVAPDAPAGSGGAGEGAVQTGGQGAFPGAPRERPDYDNALGNLFGQVNPGSVFGIWPSGDFRVNPGDGAVPALVFYLGAALGALALAAGAVGAWRQAETALLAALAAAALIWLAARVGSTPYTTAKALQMIAPLAMLVAARGLLDPLAPIPLRGRSHRGVSVLAVAFVAGAGISSTLALANAPVGPDDYSPGVRKLSNRFAGESTLLLAPANVIADQRGAEFYGWELRGAGDVEIAAFEPNSGTQPPAGVSRIVVVGGEQEPPYAGLKRIGSSNRVVLWRALDGGQ